MSETVLDRLVARCRDALAYNAGAYAAPVALLWPDEAGQWRPVIDRVGEHLPVVSLGEYDPAARRGPAYWVRCVVAGTVDAGLPAGTPIVYLPGVARSALRAVDSCPAEIAPIAELQYRSQWFSHPNNRDWSVRALLSHPDRGLGLHVADDADTSAVLTLALDRLLDERIDRLATAGARRRLLPRPHQPRSGPQPARVARRSPGLSQAARRIAVDGVRPEVQGRLRLRPGASTARCPPPASSATARAAGRTCGSVSPRRRSATRGSSTSSARPVPMSSSSRTSTRGRRTTRWPRTSSAITCATSTCSPSKARRKEIAALEVEHAARRGTVWADLDLAPLAFALEQLVLLAELHHPAARLDGSRRPDCRLRRSGLAG